MTEHKIATREWRDEAGSLHRFHYFLTVDLEETQRFCWENYGVHITEENGGSALVPAITPSASRIDELFTLLVDHGVGPAGLEDILADWL